LPHLVRAVSTYNPKTIQNNLSDQQLFAFTPIDKIAPTLTLSGRPSPLIVNPKIPKLTLDKQSSQIIFRMLDQQSATSNKHLQ
jgi:hypothetical protein